MKVQSFQYLQAEYGMSRDLDPDDLEERNKLLAKYTYSIIVEGEHMELDNLHKWIKQNLWIDSVENIYYGKIGYNYGFAEYFLEEKVHLESLQQAIPNIYTTYDSSYPIREICKTNGYEVFISYDLTDKDAILIIAEDN